MPFRHNSSVQVKKRRLACGCFDFAFSKNRCKQHATVESVQKRMEQENERIIEADNLQTIVDDLDAIFSQWVRLSAAGKDGFINCYICDKIVHWKEAHNMHYVRRGASLYLRFDPRNNKAGCEECNKWKDGNLIKYAEKLEAQTPGITEILYEEGNLVTHPTKSELSQLISEYSEKVAVLKNKIPLQ